MKVYLPAVASVSDEGSPPRQFELLAQLDRYHQHTVVSDPEDADLLLFSEAHILEGDWQLKQITTSPLFCSHRTKSLVYDERDRPWCALPGVYASMPARSFDERYQRAWSYYRVPRRPRLPHRELLFSLVASRSNPCREPLFSIEHPRAHVEEVRNFVFYDPQSKNFAERRRVFDEILAASKFVLCPRGRGTSSIRLYEALAAGCVPVVISDEWVAPSGGILDSCILKWPEGRVGGLIELLEDTEELWPAMSSQAQEAFDDYFAENVAFHRIVELCEDLLQTGVAQNCPRTGIRNQEWVRSGYDWARVQARGWGATKLRKLRDISVRRGH